MTATESEREKSSGMATQQSDYKRDNASFNAAVAQATIPHWMSLTLMLSLIFGGCCSNVLALEALIREAPGSGTLITFSQFLLTALFTLPHYIDPSRGARNLYLKERAIPLQRWIIYTLFFITINLLNNKAFDYKISLPLHVILRSAGPVTSMLVGYLFGRKYTARQIFAVVLLFLGVVLAAFADARAKGRAISLSTVPSSRKTGSNDSLTRSQTTGFVLLFIALLLSAFQGQYTDRLYNTFGRSHWYENLFYSHILSLPVLLLDYSSIQSDFANLFATSPPVSTLFTLDPVIPLPTIFSKAYLFYILQSLPLNPILLLTNALTQYLCIRGVNLLSAQSSSLTVTIVLNVRKLVSLVLSIILFGNRVPTGVLAGAALVFVGVGLYTLPSTSSTKKERGDLTKKDQHGGTGGRDKVELQDTPNRQGIEIGNGVRKRQIQR